MMDCGRAKQLDWFLYGNWKSRREAGYAPRISRCTQSLLDTINRVNLNIFHVDTLRAVFSIPRERPSL